jgi:hypothetical protein
MYADDVSELAAARAEHTALLAAKPAPAKRRRDRRPTGETSRLAELRHRAGWSWLRVFRRLDDYEAALAQIESEEKAAADRELEKV